MNHGKHSTTTLGMMCIRHINASQDLPMGSIQDLGPISSIQLAVDGKFCGAGTRSECRLLETSFTHDNANCLDSLTTNPATRKQQ